MRAPSAPVSFEQLFAHRAWLRRLARALAADSETADDLEQEVWLRALRRPPTRRTSLRGWLGTVLRNVARDRHRRATRREAQATPPSHEDDASADALVIRAETHERVTRAVLDLDEPYRTAVLLRYVGDRPIAQVAHELDVPVETVRTRLRRARAQLRQRLDDAHGGSRRAWTLALAPLLIDHVPRSAAPAAVVGGGALLMSAKTLIPILVVLASAGVLLWTQVGSSEDPMPIEADGHTDGALTADGSHAEEAPLRGTAAPGTTPTADDVDEPAAQPSMPEPPAGLRTPTGFERAPGRIVGRVVDTDGRPVFDAPVRVEPQGVPDAANRAVVVQTDKGGWFRLEELQPLGGYPYLIAVVLDDGRRARSRAKPGDDPQQLIVVEGVTLAGQLVPETPDAPVASVALRLMREDAPSTELGAIAHTNEEGRFTFTDLDPGTYVLRTHRYGGPAASSEAAGVLYPVHVPDIRPPNEDLRVPVRLGRVIAGALHGPGGDLVTTAVDVELLGLTDAGDVDYTRRHRLWTRDGSFRFTGLADGQYLLTFEPNRAAPGGLAPTKLEGVVAGSEELIIDMPSGVRLQGYTAGLAGEELKATGRLYIRPTGKAAGGPGSIVVSLTNESRFRTAPLDPTQSYDILVSGFRGYMDQSIKGVYPGDQEIVIRLTPAHVIRGRVKAIDGAKLPIAIPVSARATSVGGNEPGAGTVAYTMAGGSFQLEGIGDYVFRISAGGGASGFVCAGVVEEVKAGTTDVVVLVKKGVTFSGRLVDADDNPVKAPRMGASGVPHIGGIDCTTAVEGEDGRFTFVGVPKGKIQIWAYVGGTYVRMGEFTAPAKDVTIKLPER